MPRAILLCGPIASGKSTYAERLRRKGFYVHSRDEVRIKLRQQDRAVEERIVWDTFMAEILADLRKGRNIVADATFSNPERRDDAIRRILELGLEIDLQMHRIRTPLGECIRRNRLRDPDRRIPVDQVMARYDEIERTFKTNPPNCAVVEIRQ